MTTPPDLAVLTERLDGLIRRLDSYTSRIDKLVLDHEQRLRVVEAQQRKAAGAAAVLGALAGALLTFIGGAVLWLLRAKSGV